MREARKAELQRRKEEKARRKAAKKGGPAPAAGAAVPGAPPAAAAPGGEPQPAKKGGFTEMSLFGLKLGRRKGKREAAQAEQRLAEARAANERAVAAAQAGGPVPPAGQMSPWEEQATTVQQPTGELSAVPPVPPPPIPGGTPAPGDYDPAAAEQRVRDRVAEVRTEQQRIGAEAERRLQAAEQLQQGGAPPAGEPQPIQDAQPAAPQAAPSPSVDLHTAEQRLEEERAAREREMKEAEERLRQIEERTKAAEERAAEAKRLEQRRAEEAAKDRRLEEMRRSVAEAEERAREAERRATEAEQAAVQSVQGGAPPTPPPPAPEPQSFAQPTTPSPAETQSFQPPSTPPPAAPAPQAPPQSEGPPPPPPAPAEPFPSTPPPPAESFNPPTPPPQPAAPSFGAGAPQGGSAQVNLNTVTFEQLREENLSVTQATRLLAHRERLGGFQSVDDLDQVAGFPVEMLEDLKSRSTV